MAYHEPYELLGDDARDLSRLLRSLIEELEAIDWYNQRMSVSKDPDVKAVVKHNRDEEMEHAAMVLEIIRRRVPEFDKALRTYLFTEGPITEIEAASQEGPNDDGNQLLRP
ncbi:encapsulin-associated ferritin-like protein [Fervidobacterium thailandense]|uniref:Ferritin n=1 Tax=Fervidobacterium thailandense TaxID=1008305 RepID=A0A1E3G1K1_9BACT|nr:ferritin-like domain-containing protein [Fervidobacterium thailandense]ODN30149.1 ferritin [Fervidobacterium thailandense]